MMKNYKYVFVFCAFAILTVMFYVVPTKASEPLSGKIFVIDAGHGGVDPGTVVGKIYEKDINLKISKYLKEDLESYGATVVMTRDGDYDLGTPKATYRKKSDFDHRIQIINGSKADYYVSIHLNYLSNSRYYGPQVFYNKKDEFNEKIAQTIQEYLNLNLQTKREIKKIPQTIYMYSKLDVQGVLVECGFLSNVRERNLLLDEEYLQRFAKLLADSFLKI